MDDPKLYGYWDRVYKNHSISCEEILQSTVDPTNSTFPAGTRLISPGEETQILLTREKTRQHFWFLFFPHAFFLSHFF